jgi:hypothetical protein
MTSMKENTVAQTDAEREQELERSSVGKPVTVHWAESEFFEVWLRLARSQTREPGELRARGCS